MIGLTSAGEKSLGEASAGRDGGDSVGAACHGSLGCVTQCAFAPGKRPLMFCKATA